MTKFLFFLTSLLPLVSAHMYLISPIPLGSKDTPGIPENLKDYNYASPLSSSGSDFPCKGHLDLINNPVAGVPQATWAAGSTQSWSLTGSATHGGGSCQASISEDGGKTFKVVKSYIGGCPVPTGTTTNSFVVPKETKAGKMIFAWTWFNFEGNREMYMNCAAVTITGGGSGLAAYPEIFKANIGNGCTVPSQKNVDFPNPGKDVTRTSGFTATAPDSTWGKCGGTGTSSIDTSSTDTSSGDAPYASPAVLIAPAPSPSSSPSESGAAPSTYDNQDLPVVPSAVPECKRSVRYTRSLPVQVPVAPGCMCQCSGGGSPQLVGSCGI